VGTLRVMNRRGDSRVSWSARGLAEGDPEAEAAVREAERIFVHERERGGVAFRVQPGVLAERIDTFDPLAEDTVLVPPMVGG